MNIVYQCMGCGGYFKATTYREEGLKKTPCCGDKDFATLTEKETIEIALRASIEGNQKMINFIF